MVAVVEDDAGVRTALRQLLRSAAYDARTFVSAEEFLTADGATDVDCLIADINLPGMSGVALLQTLRLRGPIRAVLITGRDDPATLELIGRAGGVTVLRKPFNDNDLFTAIHDVMKET